MKCPDCGSTDIEMMVDITILAPAEMESNFTKRNLRKKEVKQYGAHWDRAAYFCTKCTWKSLPRTPDYLKKIANLPSDEEIYKFALSETQQGKDWWDYDDGFVAGAKWLKSKLEIKEDTEL